MHERTENISFSQPFSLFPSGLILISSSPRFSLSYPPVVTPRNPICFSADQYDADVTRCKYRDHLLPVIYQTVRADITLYISISCLSVVYLTLYPSKALARDIFPLLWSGQYKRGKRLWFHTHTLAGRSFSDGAWSPGVCGGGPLCFVCVCVCGFAVLHDLAGFLLLILCWYWHSEVE